MATGKFLDSESIRHLLQSQLTLLDFIIIGLGCSLIIYQIFKRFSISSTRFYNNAREDKLYLAKTEVTLNYISSLIELLPIMGILGTVWGLWTALSVISAIDNPTIKDIATHIAPALSTTFFGLLFAVINLLFFNFMQTYFAELIAWCREHLPMQDETLQESSEKADEKA